MVFKQSNKPFVLKLLAFDRYRAYLRILQDSGRLQKTTIYKDMIRKFFK